MRYMKCILVIAASLALFACGKTSTTGTGVISLNGGNGGTAAGGTGGLITTFSHSTSMVHGDLRFHAGGTVNAVFTLPIISPDFGSNPATITSNTPVVFRLSTDPLPPAGTYFVTDSDLNLHLVNQAGTADSIITGLTVNGGTTLSLPSTNGHMEFTGGIVINGTVTNSGPIDLRSGSFLQSNGLVSTKPPLAANGVASGQINLFSGGTLINQGTIEGSGANGTGAAGGASGGVTLHAATFLYNTGIINARGGNSDTGAGGAGGAIQLLADAASVATNGTIDSGGGSGGSGGAAGAITAFGGASPSVVGRVSVDGTVTGNGGSGTTGDGGAGGAISLTSFSGGILLNTNISANGGTSTGGTGGGAGALQLDNRLGNDNAVLHQVSPEGIKVTGNLSLNGGQGAAGGGVGGRISVASDIAPDALPGFGTVEFFGYQGITLNGGTSISGAGGAGGAVKCGISSPGPIVGFLIPAGGVFNEVALTARGGDNNPASATKNAPGGMGGSIAFTTPQTAGETADPARTLVTSSGGIDISGGAGTTGGAGGSASMSGYGIVTMSGGITSRGGTGTTQGGGNASINLFSSSNVVSSGGIIVSGGDGINGGTGGNGGSVTVKSGNQASTSGIAANGGNSATGSGGNGGTIVLFSAFALTSRSGLNVARGSGGTTAVNGSIKIDGSFAFIPAGGAI